MGKLMILGMKQLNFRLESVLSVIGEFKLSGEKIFFYGNRKTRITK